MIALKRIYQKFKTYDRSYNDSTLKEDKELYIRLTKNAKVRRLVCNGGKLVENIDYSTLEKTVCSSKEKRVSKLVVSGLERDGKPAEDIEINLNYH